MGAVSYYKSEGEYRAREKTGPSRKMVLTSQRFVRTRENAAEFRRAVRAGMLVRHSLSYLLKDMKLADSCLSGRLNALLLKIVKSDPVNDRGKRTVAGDNLEWLEDFAFHKEHVLGTIFPVGPASSIDRITGNMKMTIRPFDPQQRVNAPAGATHFKVMTVAGILDFDKERWSRDLQQTDYLPLDAVSGAICLEHAPQVNAGQSLILAMGVVFYACTKNGHYERVNGGSMRVLQVSNLECRIPDSSAEQVGNKITIDGQAKTGLTAKKQKLRGVQGRTGLYTKSRDSRFPGAKQYPIEHPAVYYEVTTVDGS